MKKGQQPVTLFKEAWVWSKKEEFLYKQLCVGFTLHLCCGTSRLGNVRADLLFPSDVKADMYNLPFRDEVFDTLICDPPWHGPSTWWKWIKFINEVCRVTKKRIIFVLGNLFFILPKPWNPVRVFIPNKISPQIKSICVWERGVI